MSRSNMVEVWWGGQTAGWVEREKADGGHEP